MTDAGQQSAVDVSVVVVSYNALDWLRRCLDAVTRDQSATRAIEVVVVDNASSPEVREYLATGPHGVVTLQQDENRGFGRACNLGIEASRGRLVMLLNPDAVLHTGAVEALAAFLDADPRRGLVGGRTLRPDGTLDPSSCWGAPTVWSWFCSAVGLTTLFRRSALFDPESLGGWQRDTVREVDIVTGCLLMADRQTWRLLGGFDPDYFMYGEDADLSARAWESGWRPAVTPDAVAVHAVGASSSRRVDKQRLLLRGKATYARKRWAPGRRTAGLVVLGAGIGLRAAAETVLRREDRTMRTLWAERRQWLAGWPPAPVDAPRVDLG